MAEQEITIQPKENPEAEAAAAAPAPAVNQAPQDDVEYEILKEQINGLVYDWEIKISAKPIISDLEKKISGEQQNFEMQGYRKGKVPLDIIRKKMGPDLLSKIIEMRADMTLRKLLQDKNIRPAVQPTVEVTEFKDKEFLLINVHVEAIPDTPKVKWEEIQIERYEVEITEGDLQKAKNEIKDKFKTFSEAPAEYAAKKGDAVMISFHGKINGEDFDGNKAENIRLELGSNQFIPGFEDQLIGAKTGMEVKVRVTFPKNYTNQSVANKPAVFDVKVLSVLKPESVDDVDDEFAKKLGLDSLEKLEELIKEKITADFNGLARLSMKKKLFDKIDQVYRFEIPPSMIRLDFEAMWNELQAQKQSNPKMFKGKDEAKIKADYEEIAKRRVRLGILLAEIARDHNLEISEEDLQQAIFAEAMMRPGQERMVAEFYENPQNRDRLKGPILEEKAVDLILNWITVKNTPISSEDFFAQYTAELAELTGESIPAA